MMSCGADELVSIETERCCDHRIVGSRPVCIWRKDMRLSFWFPCGRPRRTGAAAAGNPFPAAEEAKKLAETCCFLPFFKTLSPFSTKDIENKK